MQKKSVLSEKVFLELKDRILLNRIHPGSAIGEKMVAEEFGVSRTPVRQALQKLESLKLVEICDGVGTFVTSPTQHDMEDAYQIRCAIESIAIETAVANMTNEEVEELLHRHLSLKEEITGGCFGVAYEDFARADWALHDLIVERSDNQLLESCGEVATLLLRRHQAAYIAGYVRAADEHIALLRAIAEHDVQGAKAVLSEHLRVRPILDADLKSA